MVLLMLCAESDSFSESGSCLNQPDDEASSHGGNSRWAYTVVDEPVASNLASKVETRVGTSGRTPHNTQDCEPIAAHRSRARRNRPCCDLNWGETLRPLFTCWQDFDDLVKT